MHLEECLLKFIKNRSSTYHLYDPLIPNIPSLGDILQCWSLPMTGSLFLQAVRHLREAYPLAGSLGRIFDSQGVGMHMGAV